MGLRRVQVGLLGGLLAPIQNQGAWYDVTGEMVAGPQCLTCGRVVEREDIVEEGRTWCRVLFRCHGAEELRTYEFESENWPENAYDPEDRYQQLRRLRLADRLFDPIRHGETPYSAGGLPA